MTTVRRIPNRRARRADFERFLKFVHETLEENGVVQSGALHPDFEEITVGDWAWCLSDGVVPTGDPE